MNIIIDSNKVGIFLLANCILTDTGIIFPDGSINHSYNTSNSSVIDATLPEYPVDFAWKWENDSWVCINPEAVSAWEAQQIEQYNAQQSTNMAAAYPTQSDPIFFQWQRGLKTQQDWDDAVAAVQAQFPYKV